MMKVKLEFFVLVILATSCSSLYKHEATRRIIASETRDSESLNCKDLASFNDELLSEMARTKQGITKKLITCLKLAIHSDERKFNSSTVFNNKVKKYKAILGNGSIITRTEKEGRKLVRDLNILKAEMKNEIVESIEHNNGAIEDIQINMILAWYKLKLFYMPYGRRKIIVNDWNTNYFFVDIFENINDVISEHITFANEKSNYLNNTFFYGLNYIVTNVTTCRNSYKNDYPASSESYDCITTKGTYNYVTEKYAKTFPIIKSANKVVTFISKDYISVLKKIKLNKKEKDMFKKLYTNIMNIAREKRYKQEKSDKSRLYFGSYFGKRMNSKILDDI